MGLMNLDLEVLVILIPVLIFALCVHEFSHGYIAYLLGDNTAANAGRLTLNPLNHLDPIGSLMIFFVGLQDLVVQLKLLPLRQALKDFQI